MILHTQTKYLLPEISFLKRDSQVSHSSKLKFLIPVLDNYDLIRVVVDSPMCNLNYDQKHLIVLPEDDKLIKLIFQYYNLWYLYVGLQA